MIYDRNFTTLKSGVEARHHPLCYSMLHAFKKCTCMFSIQLDFSNTNSVGEGEELEWGPSLKALLESRSILFDDSKGRV